jgi:predicted DsbA family dithiol-disulfide isomerase
MPYVTVGNRNSGDIGETTMMGTIQVSLTSDFICPWCLIGERRLQVALTQLPEDVAVQMRWRPFQLNPTMPKAGLDRRAYRTAKFGSWEYSQALDAQVAAAGRGDGIAFNHAGMLRTPNTWAAHRLMRLAAREGDPTRLADRLFAGYFIEGRDLSDTSQLTALAVEAGLPEARVKVVLSSEEYGDEVGALEAEGRAAGISGVPYFQIGEIAVYGAQPVEVLLDALRQAARATATT